MRANEAWARRPSWRSLLLWLAVGGAVLTACETTPNGDGTELPPEFATPVAEAQEAGIDVYWLGPSFREGTLTYRILGAVLEEDETGSALDINYSAERAEGTSSFSMTLETREHWEARADQSASSVRGFDAQPVQVGGWEATLYTEVNPRPEREHLGLVIDFGDTVGVVFAVPQIADFRQVNPLLERDRLLSRMEDLRPYEP